MNEKAHAQATRGGRQDGVPLTESNPASKQGAISPTQPWALASNGGPRIAAIVAAAVAHLPSNARFAEIGYDRGAIMLRALAARPDAQAIGSEILTHATPLPGFDVLERLTLRTGDGLTPLAPAEVSLAIVAGMGGRTIAEILTRDALLTTSIDTLVLCPSHLEADIRPALATLGYTPTTESLVHERGRFYEVIVARQASTINHFDSDPITQVWGPRLFEAQDPLLRPFLEDARRRFHAAYAHGLRSYEGSAKAALGTKLAHLEAALRLTA